MTDPEQLYTANTQSPKLKECSMVLALDIGTTNSGYAYSRTAKARDIVLNNPWGNQFGIQSNKTLTAILIDNENTLIAFGYEAHDTYDADDKSQHLFDSNFKMELYNPKMSMDSIQILSRRGDKSLPLFVLFKMSIKYLYGHAKDELEKAYNGVDEQLLRVVLTIPAIWRDSAKDFMRRAATEIGIERNRLMLALEPEAASIYCRTLQPNEMNSEQAISMELAKGTKYVVIDCGGGTVDITAHEVVEDDNVKEIHCANGGPWGGENIFREFEIILCELFGQKFIDEFKKSNLSGWFCIEKNFELLKRKYRGSASTHIDLPWALMRAFDESGLFKADIYEYINSHDGFGLSDNGKLTLSADISEKMFKSSIDKIESHISLLWQKHNIANAQYAFMVGGFSNSCMLFNRVKETIGKLKSNVHVIRPSLANIAVLKGAVIFGHRPAYISNRISRLTYGVGVMRGFKPDRHNIEKKTIVQGKAKCTDVFEIWVRKNEQVPYGESRTFTMFPSSTTSTDFTVDVFITDAEDVMYTTDSGVRKLGSMHINIPDSQLEQYQRTVKNYVFFGGTELYARIQDTARPDGASDVIEFKYDDNV